jgi:DNA-directed RNA polymerase specialized sigma subunit
MFENEGQVARCLETYADWWQPPTTSLLQVAAARRRKDVSEGFRSGVLETLDERTELCRRFWRLDERDRKILFLWYVSQLSVQQIARIVRISPRHFSRCKTKAIKAIVDPEEQPAAAS